MASVALSTPEVSKLQELLENLEAVAEEVLCDRDEIVSLDRRRNTNREAHRALKNLDKKRLAHATAASKNTATNANVGEAVEGVPGDPAAPPRKLITEVPNSTAPKGPGTVPLTHGSLYSTKTWMCIGDMFIRMPSDVVMDAIEKEQEQLDKGIKDLRDGLRPKVNQLRKLEGEEPTRGTLLKPLSKEEWTGMQQVLGGRC